MKQFAIECVGFASLALAVVMLVGPLAPPATLAFKLAMRIYTGI